MSAAVAFMAFSASAAEPKVLWTAEDPVNGVEITNWNRIFELTPAQVAELDVQPGDIFTMTVVKVNTEKTEDGKDRWPQVAMFDATVGWPPLTNEGVGGKESYPYVAKLGVGSYEMWETILNNGVNFSGGDVWVSEIGLLKAEFTVNPYAIWVGPKECGWGNGIGIDKSVFANVAPGDKLIAEFAKDGGFQFIFGGWSGCNVSTWEAGATDGFLSINNETNEFIVNFTEAQSAFVWGANQTEYDIYTLLKEGGLVMQGTSTINQVLYIPADALNNVEEYNKVVAEIEAVKSNYEEAFATLKETYPDCDFSEWSEMITGAIDQALDGATKALLVSKNEGEEFTFAFSGEDITAMIAEMQKQAPNYAAYQAVIAEIDKVEAQYEETLAKAKEENPKFDFSDMEEIITNAIKEAKDKAAIALANANEDGEEFNFPFSTEEIENMIAELSLAPLKAANQEAYEKVAADIDAVIAKYDAAVAKIKEANPDFDLTEWDIAGQLSAAKTGAAQTLDAANEDEEEYFFPFDAEYYEGMIEEMLKAAGLSGIANIEAEVAAGKAKIFTLDGKAHFAPVKGQVNVIVRGNSTVKVMVK